MYRNMYVLLFLLFGMKKHIFSKDNVIIRMVELSMMDNAKTNCMTFQYVIYLTPKYQDFLLVYGEAQGNSTSALHINIE